ncbi:S1 RNA-binding domain-containing protein [Streptomyces sp. NPDC096354]|uniref:S1 RNA-binding domain-containing protein n=1 Tax=Streptomyces sp. NPDC096354 TaxID=3366088 RepID=UPI003830C0AC
MRQLLRIEHLVAVAAVANGTVTKIVPFGVFVRLAPGVKGLLHVSDMASSSVASPDRVVRLALRRGF